MEPQNGKCQAQSKKNITFKQEHGFIDKTVAIMAAAFFIFYGIPMPTSYATELTRSDEQQDTIMMRV